MPAPVAYQPVLEALGLSIATEQVSAGEIIPIEEVEGLVRAMLAVATPFSVPGRVLVVVGTGGGRPVPS